MPKRRRRSSGESRARSTFGSGDSSRDKSASRAQLDLFADASQFFALIPTDREPILREWRARYRALETELAALAEKMQEYHFEAEPAYQAWVARSFGEELTALREFEEKIQEAELIAAATLEEANASDSPESEAYQVVLMRKERGEHLFPTPDPDAEEDDDWDRGWDEVDPDRDYREESARDDRARTRDDDREERADPEDAAERSREFFRQRRREVENEDASGESARLKTLYRKLAFALHPDANPDLSARERKIWDEVQIAYAERDLERLEILHAWTESGSEGWLDRMTHLGTLRKLVLEKRAEVRASLAGFNRLKKAVPWKYWTGREDERRIDAIRAHLELEFLRELTRLERRLREFELQFSRWRGELTRQPRRRTRQP